MGATPATPVTQSQDHYVFPYIQPGGAQFTFMVGTDWEIFKDWSTKAQDFSTRLAALDLIRGRPFEGVASGTYSWVFSELSDLPDPNPPLSLWPLSWDGTHASTRV